MCSSDLDQIRSRQVRYVTMMGMRAACLIIGAILISARPPLLPLWLALCAAGMVLLPWCAVLIANDRPPRRVDEPRRFDDARRRTPLFPTAERPALEPPRPRQPQPGSPGRGYDVGSG